MFHSTTVHNPIHLFEGFTILQNKDDKVHIRYSFPSKFNLKPYYDLIFPCKCQREKSEEYTVVASNATNDRSFIVINYIFKYDIYLCIMSLNPWFEILSKILSSLSKSDFIPDRFSSIEPYLDQIYLLDDKSYIKLPKLSTQKINTPGKILKPSLRHPYIYDMYIQEYLTAINEKSEYNKKLWLEIYWSMLLERPIIFMSKRYQKLTGSLLAAAFFIHPLSWAHKFISIIPSKTPQLLGTNCCLLGIHSCMSSVIPKTDFWNEALLVDLDEGQSRMVGGCDDAKETKCRFAVPKCIKRLMLKQMSIIDDNVTKPTIPDLEDIVSLKCYSYNEAELLYNEYQRGFHLYPLLFRTITVVLLGQYRKFFSFQDSKVIFHREAYIKDQPKLSEFLKVFIQSQCFENFICDKIDSFQQNDQNDGDRFDKERLELNMENIKEKMDKKMKNKNIKKIRSVYKVTIVNNQSFPNLVNIGRPAKISTMPNIKRKSKKPEPTSKEVQKSRTQSNNEISRKSISVTSINNPSRKSSNISYDGSATSESFSESIKRSLREKKIISDSESDGSGYSGENFSNIKKTISKSFRKQTKTNNCIRESKSEDCLTQDHISNHISNNIKKEEFVPGLVQSIVQKYNNLSTETTVNKPPRIRKTSCRTAINTNRYGYLKCSTTSPP